MKNRTRMKTSATPSRPPLHFCFCGLFPCVRLTRWKSGGRLVGLPKPARHWTAPQAGSNRIKLQNAIGLANPAGLVEAIDGCQDLCAAIRRKFRCYRHPRRGLPSFVLAVQRNPFALVRTGSHRLEPKVPPRPGSAGHRDCDNRNGSRAASKSGSHWRQVRGM